MDYLCRTFARKNWGETKKRDCEQISSLKIFEKERRQTTKEVSCESLYNFIKVGSGQNNI